MTKELVIIMVTVILIIFSCTMQEPESQTTVSTTTTVPGTTTTTISINELVNITGGIYSQTDGTNSFNHTVSNFSIGKFEVVYELWYSVYQWAILNGYTFANPGTEGHDGVAGAVPTTAKYEPVTTINWRDAIVWCNAYSEMEGLNPCYTYSSSTIKDSRDTNATACDSSECNWSMNGYRLPSEGEWNYVAGNLGVTPWNYASGATASYSDSTETQKVAWYNLNSEGYTHNVGTTTNSSALTLWDMSGNVWEWCWDWYGNYPDTTTDYHGPSSGSDRTSRGGAWLSASMTMRIGSRNSFNPSSEFNSFGFRVARSQ
jgi:sulfatase modifying factor 1